MEEKLEKKVQELKETHQHVRHNLEYNDFANTTGHLLQVQEAEDDLQKKDKHAAQLEDILETKQGAVMHLFSSFTQW